MTPWTSHRRFAIGLHAGLLVLATAGPASGSVDEELFAAEREYQCNATRPDLERLFRNVVRKAPPESGLAARAHLYLARLARRLRPGDVASHVRAALLANPDVQVDELRDPRALRDLLSVERARMRGHVLIAASEAAVVFVGDSALPTPVGSTPLSLPVGRTRFRVVSKDGLRAWQGDLVVRANAPVTVPALLSPIPSTLRVRGLPFGAVVRIDGREVGRAPLPDLSLAAGIHSFLVRAKRHLAVEGKVRLLPESVSALDLKLPPIPPLAPWYRRARPWGLVALSAGAAMIATGAALGASAESLASDLRRDFAASTLSVSRYDSLISSARSRTLAAKVLFGIGGATAAAGVVLTIWRARDPAPTSLGIGPLGLVLTRRLP